MTAYMVFEPPPAPRNSRQRAERIVFVPDRFIWSACVFGPLWMLWHRLWIVFGGYIGVSVALSLALHYAGVGEDARSFALTLLSLLVGFEAASLRRWTLLLGGWRDLGTVVGDTREAAERRFFDRYVAFETTREMEAALAAPPPPSRPPSAPRDPTDVVGLFPQPGRHVSVAIVDYDSGNLHSAAKAFERAARETGDDQPILVTRDPDAVARADRVVLPGVGAFADCRRGLDAVSGMVEALDVAVRQKGRPFFGICVGMQLMAERGREYEVTPGLGWIAGEVDRIKPDDPELKIPHMGWNTLNELRHHPLLDGIATGADGLHAYFVHSYELKAANRADLVAQADYGGAVTAIVARDTMLGTQFHPEKSQRLGLALIANFLKWSP